MDGIKLGDQVTERNEFSKLLKENLEAVPGTSVLLATLAIYGN